MAVGELVTYLQGRFKGYPGKVTVSAPATLGGYSNPRRAEFEVSIDKEMEPVLLTVFVSGKSLLPRMPWRVRFGTVNLIREFRPQTLTTYKERSYAAMVFDVTKLVKESGKYPIIISCDSAEPVEVNAVEVVGVVKDETTVSDIVYSAGAAVIPPGESFSFKFPAPEKDIRNAGVYILATIPSTQSVLRAVMGDTTYEIRNIIGTDEYFMRLPPTTSDDIELRYEILNPLATGTAVLHSLTLFRTPNEGPKLSVTAKLEGGNVVVSISNEGDTAAENTMLVVISAGHVIFRARIGDVLPGRTVTREVPIKGDIKGRRTVARVIYDTFMGQRIEDIDLTKMLRE